MWGAFHRLRTSEMFTSHWKNFLKETISANACPIFFQHLTSTIFMDMVWQEFPVVETETPRQEQVLSYEEKNTLQYAAGYVPRHLKKRLQKSAHPLKEELTLCLLDLQDGEEDDVDCSAEWVKAVNRGGLSHVNSATYCAFLAMELELRKHINLQSVHNVNDDFKKKVLKSIIKNEDVLFHWMASWKEVCYFQSRVMLNRTDRLLYE